MIEERYFSIDIIGNCASLKLAVYNKESNGCVVCNAWGDESVMNVGG